MIQTAANAIILLTSIYLILLGVAALARPRLAGQFLLGFAKSPVKHYAELSVRLIVGAAFIAAAPSASHPSFFATLGWVLVGTTALMIFLPWELHDKIARRSVPKALPYLPLIGFSSIAFGGFVFTSVVRGYAA